MPESTQDLQNGRYGIHNHVNNWRLDSIHSSKFPCVKSDAQRSETLVGRGK